MNFALVDAKHFGSLIDNRFKCIFSLQFLLIYDFGSHISKLVILVPQILKCLIFFHLIRLSFDDMTI